MQSTSRIQSITSTLMKNFFIVGIDQKALITQMGDQRGEDLKPEVLFSMYQKKDFVKNYLQYIFPEKVLVEFKPQEPKFFTFMSTDSEGFNAFFHCLIFFDEINDAEINYDTDNMDAFKKHIQSPTKTRPSKPAEASDDEDNGQHIQNTVRKDLRKRLLLRKDTTGFLDAIDLAKIKNAREKQDPSQEGSPRIQKVKDNVFLNAKIQADIQAQKFQQLTHNALGSSIITPSGRLLDKSRQGGMSNNVSAIGASNIGKGQMQPDFQRKKRTNTEDEKYASKKFAAKGGHNTNTTNHQYVQGKQQYVEDSSMNFGKQAEKVHEFNIRILQPICDDQKEVVRKKHFKMSNISLESEQSCGNFGGYVKHLAADGQSDKRVEMDLNSDLHNISQDPNLQYMTHEQLLALESQYHYHMDNNTFNAMLSKKKYVPVAFCLETETEFHDVFREILLSLFEMIRVPESLLTGNIAAHANRLVSFAELISHLAFLKTLPSPTFNTIYNVQFLNQVIVIKENPFDQIPNKSSQAIKILMDVLDIRSIFFCWKALLFDKSLVLVSSQYSLQFYIAEALKQLLFPLAWQGSYIQPGNDGLLDLCDGTITMIYAQSNVFSSYDYFEGLNSTEMAICDIDASLTNELQLQALLQQRTLRDGKDRTLPSIHQEQMYIKLLNLLKNQRVSQYDMAFQQTPPDNEEFVQNVRDTFFQMLKPYLVNIHSCMKSVDDPASANFYKYFDQHKYKSYFEDCDTQLRFAENLLQSSQFIHLCDDYFSEELTNFHQMTAILKQRGELSNEDLSDKYKELELKFQNSGSPAIDGREEMLQEDENAPEEGPFVINVRLPQDSSRILLFDRVQTLIEAGIKRKQKSENSSFKVKDNLKYELLIKEIKKFYPIKIKGSYKQYQQNDQKIMQTNFQKKINEAGGNSKGLAKTQNQQPQQVQAAGARESLRQSTDSRLINNKERKQTATFQFENGENEDNVKIMITQSNFQQQNSNQLRGGFPYMRNNQYSPGQALLTVPQSNEITVTQSYIQMSSSLITVSQDEEQSRKIVKLIYWQNGLLQFINSLFGQIKEKNKKEVNYYFILKEQLKKMSGSSDFNPKIQRKRVSNNAIVEDSKEDSFVENSPFTKSYKLTKQMTVPTPSSSNTNLPLHRLRTGGGNSDKNVDQQMGFYTSSDWFKVAGWETKKAILQNTYQFILMRLKIYEMFECCGFYSDHLFVDLQNYPSDQWRFFPQTKFQEVWNSLAQNQQEQVIAEHGWNKSQTIWGYFIWKFYNKSKNKVRMLYNSNVSNASSSNMMNDSIFFKAHLEKEPSTPGFGEMKNSGVQRKNSGAGMAGLNNGYEKSHTGTAQKQQVKLENISRESIKSKIKQKKPSIQILTEEKPKLTSKNSQSDETFLFVKSTSSPMYKFGQNSPRSKNSSDSGKSREKKNSNDMFNNQADIASMKQSIFNSSDVSSGGSISLNCHLGGQRNSKPSKISTLENPELISYKMLSKMIKFWSKNKSFLKEKLNGFQKPEIERITEELQKFEDLIKYFAKRQPDFNDNEIVKQVFLINIFNYLVLHKLAVLMICSPEAIKMLRDYNMWQQFLISCCIVIAGVKIDAYLIMTYYLRNTCFEFSQFMIKTPDMEGEEARIFKVKNPNKLNMFGLFLGLKGFRYLKKFKKETFNEQLRILAEEYIGKKLTLKENSKLITTQKNIHWLVQDLDDKSLRGILIFIKNEVLTKSDSRKLIKTIEKVLLKLETNEENEKNYLVQYKWFDWKIRAKRFKEAFKLQGEV